VEVRAFVHGARDFADLRRRTTTMKAADVEVKSIGPDLAVVLFRWDIGGAADAAGKAVGTFRGSTLFVAASQANRWTVLTGQVATAPSAR
jgi:ABC-type amino acid transport substrate-binding protein